MRAAPTASVKRRAGLAPPMPTIRLAPATREAILAHARAGLPDEVCGVLVGAREGQDVVVHRAVPTRNAHPAPRHEYLIDPQELLSIVLEAEDEEGLEVVGFYHSHPIGPPHLSQRDHARASWPGACYLLLWFSEPEGMGCWDWDAEARAFRARDVLVR